MQGEMTIQHNTFVNSSNHVNNTTVISLFITVCWTAGKIFNIYERHTNAFVIPEYNYFLT